MANWRTYRPPRSSLATTPLLDLLGSIRLRTDDTGSVIGTSHFEVFGGVRAQFGTQGSLGWTGELRDADTGLTYLRARDYAPGSGRFLQRDSVNPSGPGTQGYQRYAYANGNPTTFTDPSGHGAGAADFGALITIGRNAALAYSAVTAFGSALYTIGIFVLTGWALIGLVLFVILAVVGISIWCYKHGCSLPSFDVMGWLRGTIRGGQTAIEIGVTAAAGAAAHVCAATLGAFDPLGNKTRIVGGCPTISRPDRGKDDDDQCFQYEDDAGPLDVPLPTDDDDNDDELQSPDPTTGGAVIGATDGSASANRQFQVKIPGLSGKEAASDAPSWVINDPEGKPYVGEAPNQFAERMMNKKYSPGNWKTSDSEYSKIKK